MYGNNASAVCRELKVSRSSWDHWNYVPERYALQVARITGGSISAMEILLVAEIARSS